MIENRLLLRLFPFLAWFPIGAAVLRADLLAGITGALVLVPKAMAYAQLSGLPVQFGLYTALVPAFLGALWGSSRQLATGPVAVVSLMTAAALAPLAVPFTDDYIGLALLLTLTVGLIQLGLGAFGLGAIVNFISHPVILGFMNAAALIIALSQLDLLLGIPKGRSDSFLKDVWEMLGHLPQTHLPTLAMSAFALALMLGLKRIPLLSKPGVLIAVAITTVASYAAGFAQTHRSGPEAIADPALRERVIRYGDTQSRLDALRADAAARSVRLRELEKAREREAAAEMRYRIERIHLEAEGLDRENKERMAYLRGVAFDRSEGAGGRPGAFHARGAAAAGSATDGVTWRIGQIDAGQVSWSGGGDIVGAIPRGLPSLRVPTLSLEAILQLFTAALIIALVAFTECVSMAKAMAVQTRQRLDPNQELIGQGLANAGGAFFQSYPATGSFTGSAINLQAGARTGLAMVFNGAFVGVTLLFLTAYLYHLPKATLGAIIVLAVASLVTPGAIKHTWKASRTDGFILAATFAITLAAAPHLEKGILLGAGLALGLYLYRTMKPRVAILGRHPDGTLRDARVHRLPASNVVTAIRFDGRLYFANVSYFEDAVLDAVASNPEAPYVLIVGDGINDLDASGEEAIRHLVERLNENGVVVLFSGLKKQVVDVMRATGLREVIGAKRFFPTAEQALQRIYARAEYAGEDDPLRPPPRTGPLAA
jgi:SulP family sulfate permease